MKKLLISISILGLVGTGFWFLSSRRARTAPPDTTAAAFKAQPFGSGVLMQFRDTQVPLRAIRWLTTSTGGIQVAQVITQNNRQQIAWFEGGTYAGFQIVPKPRGVRDGFFFFAELQDACIWPGDVAILLYRSADPSSDEPSLVLAFDLQTQDIRWIHRGQGLRLIPTPSSKEQAVYLIGPRDPIIRLPIALQKSEQANSNGLRSAATVIELPSEIQEIGDLLPLGPWTFLVAHRDGLSTYLGVKGWSHQSLPEMPPEPFENARPTLAQGKSLWWQPQPGFLVQMHNDGTQKQLWNPEDLNIPEPFEKDAALLHLLGTDATGKLWFDLAKPAAPQAMAPVLSLPGGITPSPESRDATPATSPEEDSLLAYASQGIDRLYVWNPDDLTFRRLTWVDAIGALKPPPVITSQGIPKFHPETGSLLLQTGAFAWRLPLEALPIGAPINELKTAHPR